ncbi:carbonic anhydrase 13-like isoform X1 [Amphibalanus amphitrite]|uniref:carbonic anhydrase 13-like isoform X1 n=1 Tax=Amphibalanus amphitrite TaxID=1232801 RepID=UPI001C8FF7C2|nr:carbonic anhydrase 13-like isoform X1 [Amphibalanus amphitrite]
MAGWGYGSKNGPHAWSKQFPVGDGQRQSPIDIITAQTKPDEALEASPLEISYDPKDEQVIGNTGHGWKVDYTSGTSSIRGGPLEGEYALAQYHCHWGREEDRGSEHTIDGKRYAAELHLVHYNKKYGSFAAAADKSDGLAVIGIFLKVGKENKELLKVTNAMKDIKYNGSKTKIEPTDPDNFMPETARPPGGSGDLSVHGRAPTSSDTRVYWTYEGSLTTPPLYESVTWIVFADPTEISKEQLAEFRHLKRHANDDEKGEDSDDDDGIIADNYRPPMPTGERAVRSCNAPVKFVKKQ